MCSGSVARLGDNRLAEIERGLYGTPYRLKVAGCFFHYFRDWELICDSFAMSKEGIRRDMW